jgi:hypothetical protein
MGPKMSVTFQNNDHEVIVVSYRISNSTRSVTLRRSESDVANASVNEVTYCWWDKADAIPAHLEERYRTQAMASIIVFGNPPGRIKPE